MWKYLTALAVVSLLAFTGCELFNPIGPIIQIGIYWLEGEAHKYYATDQQTLHQATKTVLAEFKLPILNESVKGNTIHMKAGDGDKFKIKIVAVRQGVSKLSIRVNTFGDKPYAEMIYRHIDKQPGIQQFATTAELNDAMQRRIRPH